MKFSIVLFSVSTLLLAVADLVCAAPVAKRENERDDICYHVKEIIHEYLPVAPGIEMHPSSRLKEDLNGNYIMRLNVLERFEREFHLEIWHGNATSAGPSTVQDWCDFIAVRRTGVINPGPWMNSEGWVDGLCGFHCGDPIAEGRKVTSPDQP